MKKLLLVLATSVFVAATNVNAQSVKAFKGGVATDYDASSLTYYLLKSVDSIIVTGTWDKDNMNKLTKALANSSSYGDPNVALIKADFSSATFTTNSIFQLFYCFNKLKTVILPTTEMETEISINGAFSNSPALETIANLDKFKNITGLMSTFSGCSSLKEITLPNVENTNSIDLSYSFKNCTKLKYVHNLDKLSNISTMEEAFYYCSSLDSVSFSSTTNNSAKNAQNIFNSCTSLRKVMNFENFVSITNLLYAFSDCSKLEEIHIGSMPSAFGGAFDNCNAIKYFPAGTTAYKVHSTWNNITNAVVPFTSVSLNGTAGFSIGDVFALPTIITDPTYSVATDFVCELSNDDFATKETYTSNTIVTKDYTGYKMRIGAKNASMNDYVYSTDILDVTKVNYVLTAYTGRVATKYSIEQLATGTLAQVDSVVLYGDWSDAQIETFRKSLKLDGNTSTTNSALKKADLSDVTLSGDITSGMEHLFSNCKTIVSVTLPSSETAGKVSLSETFDNCSSLESIANLDKFTNITSLYCTFYSCKNLKSLSFAPTENGNSVSMFYAFYNCSLLESIANLEKLTNVVNLRYTFSNCGKLKEIHIGSNPNSLSGTQYAFDNCDALVYLPESVTTVPDNWKNYKNFVLPFTAIEPSGIATIDSKSGTISLPTVTYTPSYCVGTDFVYQISNNNFSTYTTHSATDVLTGNYVGYQVRVGAKNERMNNYVYSTNSVLVVKAPLAKAYVNGVSTEYGVSDLATGTLATADSVVLYGVWTNAQIETFRKSLKLDGSTSTTNSALKKADLSDVTLSGDITSGMEHLFSNCQNLVSVALPSSETAGKVSLFDAFYNCLSLESIANLDKFTNITGLGYAFCSCKNLKSLSFAPTENGNSVSLYETFENCSLLDSIANLDKFTNITNLERAFYNCIDLKEIHIGIDPNNMNTSNIDDAFSYCYAIKYLPDTVTTIPENWQGYTNFVLPFTFISLTGSVSIGADGGYVELPSVSCTPSYCIATDVAYQLSKDNFNTCTTHSATDKLPAGDYSGYKIRIGAKNETMSNYVYSTLTMDLSTYYPVVSYKGGKSTNHTFSSLAAGSLSDADTIALYGFWETAEWQLLRNALKVDGTNSTLKNVDAKYATIKEGAMNHTFANCTALEEIILPSVYCNVKVALDSTFEGCTSLKTMVNLNRLNSISSLSGTFMNCVTLSSITFSSTYDYEPVDMSGAFEGCTSLSNIYKLDMFRDITSLCRTFAGCSSLKSVGFISLNQGNCTNAANAFEGCTKLETASGFNYFNSLTDLTSTFSGCEGMSEISLGIDPNKVDSISGTFDGCGAYKCLPYGVSTVPETWISAGYNKFIVPITSIKADLESYFDTDGTMYESAKNVSIEPSYAAYTNTIWEYSNDDFATTTTSILSAQGYKARFGVKNGTMGSYIYADTAVAVKQTSTTIIAYRGSTITYYTKNDLTEGLLAEADSVVISGIWNNAQINKFGSTLNSSWTTNCNLKKFDMKDVMFADDITYGMRNLFYDCASLVSVTLPSSETAGKVSLSCAFYDCLSLDSIANLDKFTNITDLERAFYNCKNLKSLTFAPTENGNSVSMYYAFYDCSSLDSIANLDKITNITSLCCTFYSCKNLKSLSFAPTDNGNGVILYETFKNCSSLDSIANLDKFTNITNLEYAFYNCINLKEIHIGIDPNNMNTSNIDYAFSYCYAIKYLPDTVTTIPDIWQSYSNFILPITDVKGGSVSYGNEIITISRYSCYPSYCAATDTIYAISNDGFVTTQTIKPGETISLKAGEYKVKVGFKNERMSDYCYAEPYTLTIINSIDEQSVAELSIYPNPATTTFHVSVGNRNAEVFIYDAVGQLQQKLEVHEEATIDISSLPQGIYYVKADQQVLKLVKR